MSRIHDKDTKIEVLVRKYLFAQGFRFRKNDKRYPGKPDVVLPKYITIIFINGCFWHHHEGCKNATIPKTNTNFWTEKLKKNVLNDQKNALLLTRDGWQVLTLWECELEHDFEATMISTVQKIRQEQE